MRTPILLRVLWLYLQIFSKFNVCANLSVTKSGTFVQLPIPVLIELFRLYLWSVFWNVVQWNFMRISWSNFKFTVGQRFLTINDSEKKRLHSSNMLLFNVVYVYEENVGSCGKVWWVVIFDWIFCFYHFLMVSNDIWPRSVLFQHSSEPQDIQKTAMMKFIPRFSLNFLSKPPSSRKS